MYNFGPIWMSKQWWIIKKYNAMHHQYTYTISNPLLQHSWWLHSETWTCHTVLIFPHSNHAFFKTYFCFDTVNCTIDVLIYVCIDWISYFVMNLISLRAYLQIPFALFPLVTRSFIYKFSPLCSLSSPQQRNRKAVLFGWAPGLNR